MDPVEGARSFATTGDAYDRFMGRYSRLLAVCFADAAGVAGGQAVLDVGCGPGALTGVLVERLGSASVAACDPSPPFVEACRDRHPGVDLVVDPDAPDEARTLRFGQPGEIAEQLASAGFVDIEESVGSFCVSLDDDRRAALRQELFRGLGSPEGPIRMTAAARCSVGRRPG
ncbi:MAG: class I SAM-dependent methyltransferase [Acidimicrobiales bacterium]